jgi:predicted type IV restriction endonuclease
MSFSDIRRAVRDARENIKSRRNLLENSEAQTRIVLIDPVLRAVGWDTSNPAMVRSEYGANGGRADYALLNPETESPLIIVEAKKLGDVHLEQHIPQIAGYSEGEGSSAQYGVITNGNIWRVFENGAGFMNNIMAISMTADTDDKCAAELARLLTPPAYAASRSSGERSSRYGPSSRGIPTTPPLFGGAYGPLFPKVDINRSRSSQSDTE